MYKQCRTEKSLARQRELEQGFLEYMDTVSFSDIEIADLCRSLNIPRKTFYRYFGSKEDALNALVDHKLVDMLRFVEAHAMNSVHPDWDSSFFFFTFWKQNKVFLDILSRNYLMGVLTFRAAMQTYLPSNADFHFVSGPMSAKSYMLNFIGSGLMAMMIQWYLGNFQNDIAELANITQTLFHGSVYQIPELQ